MHPVLGDGTRRNVERPVPSAHYDITKHRISYRIYFATRTRRAGESTANEILIKFAFSLDVLVVVERARVTSRSPVLIYAVYVKFRRDRGG